MAKKNIFKNKSLWKKIGLGCLAGALSIGAIAGVSALVRESEETTKIINPTYAVGGLTENGAYLETESSLYTENAFECQGLDVELDFKSNVSYRIFFYDSENDFMSATAKQSGNYDETTTPFGAMYARVVITPNDDEEIKWYEKNGYAKQLEISVNKNQVSKFEDLLKDYENKANPIGEKSIDFENMTFVDGSIGAYFYDFISVDGEKTAVLKVKESCLNYALNLDGESMKVGIYNFKNGEMVGISFSNNYVKANDGSYYMLFDLLDCDTIVGFVDAASLDSLEVYVV